MADGLASASGGFNLAPSGYAQAPTFPSGLGKVLAIDPEAIAQAAVKGIQQGNDAINNPQQQRAVQTSLAAQVAQNRLNQAAATGEQGILPDTLAARAAAQRAAAGQSGAIIQNQPLATAANAAELKAVPVTAPAVAAATVAGANEKTANSNFQTGTINDFANGGADQLAARIKQANALTDPNDKRTALQNIQADFLKLNATPVATALTPANAGEQQATSQLAADAAQRNELAKQALVNQGHENVATIMGQWHINVADTNDAAKNSVMGALKYMDMANQSLEDAYSGGNPNEIGKAIENVKDAQLGIDRYMAKLKADTDKSVAQGGAYLTPAQVQAKQDAEIS